MPRYVDSVGGLRRSRGDSLILQHNGKQLGTRKAI